LQVAPDEVVDLCSGDGHSVVRRGKAKGEESVRATVSAVSSTPLLRYLHHMNLAFGIWHLAPASESGSGKGKR
jgi:hypothetical protein